MIKKLIKLFANDATKLPFWERLERKEKIKQIDHEFKLLKEGLAARQDQEFLIYAVAKFLELHEKQQRLIKSY
jgi:hypothetical protein